MGAPAHAWLNHLMDARFFLDNGVGCAKRLRHFRAGFVRAKPRLQTLYALHELVAAIRQPLTK
jgi:hypothetical protein